MRHPNHSPIDDLVSDCCQELFAAYDVSLEPADSALFPPRDHLLYCSVMGFGGRQVRGALVLVSTVEPLELTHSGDEESHQDWVRELSNQLMGRVKNRLLSFGAEVMLATPAAISGKNLDLTSAKPTAPQVFRAASGVVSVWIECDYLGGFELPTTPSGKLEAALPEGEALLF
ncbi:MAG: chemotaxis protein CheX [Myxococcales bacterium]|nr:MAG: chemotaxis protein CheX [Myxococcales bacterium]